MSNTRPADWDQTRQALDKLNTAYGMVAREFGVSIETDTLKSYLAGAIRDLQQALGLK